jgi:hypothetical protein
VVPLNTLGALVSAEIDTQIATAKRYPRSIGRFKSQAKAMATMDEETAASCFYTLPRAGKSISGPSVRLAEIVGSAWGNIRYSARVIADDGKILTAQGVCIDLETNVAASVEVRRRVTDKRGRRFTDDMIVVTGNAACSIALRNAIFKVVPGVYVKDVLHACREVAIGDAKTLATKRADMVAYFGKMGVLPERVYAAVGKASAEDIGLEELAALKGMATAIRDGDSTIEEVFPPPEKPTSAPPVGRSNLGGKPNGHGPAEPRKPADEPAVPGPQDAPTEPVQSTEGGAPAGAPGEAAEPESQPADEEGDMTRQDSADQFVEKIRLAQTPGDLDPLKRELLGAADWLGKDLYAAVAEALKAKEQTFARPSKNRKDRTF